MREYVRHDPTGTLRAAVDNARIGARSDELRHVLAERIEERALLKARLTEAEIYAEEREPLIAKLRQGLALAETLLAERDAEIVEVARRFEPRRNACLRTRPRARRAAQILGLEVQDIPAAAQDPEGAAPSGLEPASRAPPPSSMSRAPAPMYFPNVNLLRAFAALLVLVYHVIELAPWPEFPTAGPGLLFRAGWVGVDLFFVISGFVIGLSAIRLYRDGARDYRRTFLRRRLARIVPLYVFTCAAFLLMVQPAVLSLPWGKLALQLVSHLLFLAQSPSVAARRDQRPQLERGGGNAVLRARDRRGAAHLADRCALAAGRRRAHRVGIEGARVLGHA